MNNKKIVIKVCHGHACSGRFSKYILERAQAEADGREGLICEECPCQGNCEKGPTVIITKNDNDQKYSHMDPNEIAKIMKKF